jgi:hypothetical protein
MNRCVLSAHSLQFTASGGPRRTDRFSEVCRRASELAIPLRHVDVNARRNPRSLCVPPGNGGGLSPLPRDTGQMAWLIPESVQAARFAPCERLGGIPTYRGTDSLIRPRKSANRLTRRSISVVAAISHLAYLIHINAVLGQKSATE